MATLKAKLGLPDKYNVLVVAAHPDDETIGLGGTLNRMAFEGGLNLYVVFVTDGVSSRAPKGMSARETMARNALHELVQRDIDDPKLLDDRMCNTLRCDFWGMKDQALCSLNVAKLATLLNQAVQVIRPFVIFTHYAGDLNADHRVVAEATRIATQDTPHPLRLLLAYPTWSSTEHAFSPFVPNFFVTLSEESIVAKTRAIKQYHTEVRGDHSPRSPSCLLSRAVVDGSNIRSRFAEGFQLIRAAL